MTVVTFSFDFQNTKYERKFGKETLKTIVEYNSKENSEIKFDNKMFRKFQKQKFNENLEIKYSRNIGNKSINKKSAKTYCRKF